uniref:Uncharacterized protein n=1 Tax=Steinernema glaseri TaxID=37863 RepID=A0A1I7Z170_9BILA
MLRQDVMCRARRMQLQTQMSRQRSTQELIGIHSLNAGPPRTLTLTLFSNQWHYAMQDAMCPLHPESRSRFKSSYSWLSICKPLDDRWFLQIDRLIESPHRIIFASLLISTAAPSSVILQSVSVGCMPQRTRAFIIATGPFLTLFIVCLLVLSAQNTLEQKDRDTWAGYLTHPI